MPTSSQPRPRPDPIPIPISITISGTGGCGKSSITLRLVRSQWTNSYDPTIEDSYSVTRIVDGQPYILSLTDTAGQEEYRSMWAASNLQSDAFLLVYDITSMASLEELDFFNNLVDIEGEQREEKNATFDHIRQRAEERRHPCGVKSRATGGGSGKQDSPKMLARPVKILAGNKCDLSASRQVPAAIGLDWARRRGCGFMETSARNTVNIEETFALLVRRVMEARRVAEMATTMGLAAVKVVGEEVIESYDRGGYDRFGRKLSNGDLANGGGGQRQMQMAMGLNATKPLSPLPEGSLEKSFMDDEVGGGGRRRGRWWDVRSWGWRCW